MLLWGCHALSIGEGCGDAKCPHWGAGDAKCLHRGAGGAKCLHRGAGDAKCLHRGAGDAKCPHRGAGDAKCLHRGHPSDRPSRNPRGHVMKRKYHNMSFFTHGGLTASPYLQDRSIIVCLLNLVSGCLLIHIVRKGSRIANDISKGRTGIPLYQFLKKSHCA